MVSGCVYGIYENSNALDILYVGSTKNIRRRIMQHRTCAKRKTYPLYQYIRDHGGFDKFGFLILKTVPFTTRTALAKIEEKYRKRLEPPLNHNVCHVSVPRSEYHREYNRTYYQNNKKRASDASKRYYHKNNERIREERKARYYTSTRCPACKMMVIDINRHRKNKKHLTRAAHHRKFANVMNQLKESLID